MTVHYVKPRGLNLRTEPKVEAETQIAVLPKRHLVETREGSGSSGWAKVKTRFDGKMKEGYVSSRYLGEVADLQVINLKVDASALNIRSAPRVQASNKIAVLPEKHPVTAIETSQKEGWVKVATLFDGSELSGYVASRFLVADADKEGPPASGRVTKVHLRENYTASRRDHAGKRAFPIGEEGRPERTVNGSRQEKVRALTQIINWLDVENSARYDPTSTSTYCNIYAYDYCYLAGVYLPRVWWQEKALLRLQNGEEVTPRYGDTLHELNANSLFDWLRNWGGDFGWKRVFELDALQNAANEGKIGVMVAKHKNPENSGHITVIAPENDQQQASRRNGQVKIPLQSQAGRNNYRYTINKWWASDRYRNFGYWIHS